ncbi:MAG: type II toxin-antitoxin system RelE/ParE family toxin [Trichormus sp.]
MKVYWTTTAVENLSAIYAYIAQTSPQYATRVVDRITRRSEQIVNFPMSGRTVPEFETEQIREIIEGSYRIIYYIKPEQIDVLAVIHGSQQITSSSMDE